MKIFNFMKNNLVFIGFVSLWVYCTLNVDEHPHYADIALLAPFFFIWGYLSARLDNNEPHEDSQEL